MKDETIRLTICPKCGKPYSGHPALSRLDNQTLICSDCGTREALETLGISFGGPRKVVDFWGRGRAPE